MSARLNAALAGLLLSSVLAGAAAPALPVPSRVERQLLKPVSVTFNQTPLHRVIDDLRCRTGANIVADLRAFHRSAASMERPVTIKINQVSLKSALHLILHQARLTFVIEGEAVVVLTEEHGGGRLQTVRYPVRDLLSSRKPGSSGKLVELITNAVAPAAWNHLGGRGTIEYSPMTGSLVINQTDDAHEQVADLLGALRRGKID